jgi:hypothetical protein
MFFSCNQRSRCWQDVSLCVLACIELRFYRALNNTLNHDQKDDTALLEGMCNSLCIKQNIFQWGVPYPQTISEAIALSDRTCQVLLDTFSLEGIPPIAAGLAMANVGFGNVALAHVARKLICKNIKTCWGPKVIGSVLGPPTSVSGGIWAARPWRGCCRSHPPVTRGRRRLGSHPTRGRSRVDQKPKAVFYSSAGSRPTIISHFC